jgi:hypothetical protein
MNSIVIYDSEVQSHHKFENHYEILNMYSYLNHPYYNNFIQYLTISNKTAIIFCKSNDEVFNILKSDLIKIHKVNSMQERGNILKEYQNDFYACSSASSLTY